jgi:hypothetical protein
MRINKHDIPTVIDAPGAVARQVEGFGQAAEPMAGEYFSLAPGADIAPLLEGPTYIGSCWTTCGRRWDCRPESRGGLRRDSNPRAVVNPARAAVRWWVTRQEP